MCITEGGKKEKGDAEGEQAPRSQQSANFLSSISYTSGSCLFATGKGRVPLEMCGISRKADYGQHLLRVSLVVSCVK